MLCQNATELLGPRREGGNIRGDGAATMARIVKIKNHTALKGCDSRMHISRLQHTEHLSIFDLKMESDSAKPCPPKIRDMCAKAFDQHSLAPLLHLTCFKSFMCCDTGKMLICQEKRTKARNKLLHFVKAQMMLFSFQEKFRMKKLMS